MGTIVDGGIQSVGQLIQGEAQSRASMYNAAIQKQNAAIAGQNANIASQAGAVQAGDSELRTRATTGNLKVNEAAGGVDVNSGSAVGVQQSAAELGELDALTIRSNATREAYGYTVQQTSDKAEASLDQFAARNDAEGAEIGAAGTFLGSLDQGASNFAKFAMQGGFGG